MAQRRRLKFRRLAGSYAIVRLAPDSPVPDWAMQGDLISITRTSDELSIVCPVDNVPAELQVARCWACLKLEGPFDLPETGVLLSFIEPLSANDVPVFAISTYDTDYILIRQESSDRALMLLAEAGHEALP